MLVLPRLVKRQHSKRRLRIFNILIRASQPHHGPLVDRLADAIARHNGI